MSDRVEDECVCCGEVTDDLLECDACGEQVCAGCAHPGEDDEDGEPTTICRECEFLERQIRAARERQGEGGA